MAVCCSLLSNNDKAEPRFQISDGPSTQLVFGMDVDNSAKGGFQLFTQNNPAIFGYPVQNLKDLPNGDILCTGITSSL